MSCNKSLFLRDVFEYITTSYLQMLHYDVTFTQCLFDEVRLQLFHLPTHRFIFCRLRPTLRTLDVKKVRQNIVPT